MGLLFGTTGEGYGVEPESRRLAIVAVQVNGVPQIAVARRSGWPRRRSRPPVLGSALTDFWLVAAAP